MNAVTVDNGVSIIEIRYEGGTYRLGECTLPRGVLEEDIPRLLRFFRAVFEGESNVIHFRTRDVCNGGFKYPSGHYRKKVSAADSMKSSLSGLKGVHIVECGWEYVVERDPVGNQSRRGYKYLARRSRCGEQNYVQQNV